MVDKEVETPMHFVDKNLDPSYCWNEWELRRKVSLILDLRLFKWQTFENVKQKHHRLYLVTLKWIARYIITKRKKA